MEISDVRGVSHQAKMELLVGSQWDISVGKDVHYQAKPEDLNSVPKIHTMEAENRSSESVLGPPRAHRGMHTHVHVHAQNK